MKIFVVIFFIGVGINSCSKEDVFLEPEINGKDITINVRNLAEKTPVFYKTKIDKKEIEFFVIKVNSEVSAYLNRCRKCFNSGRGFSFDETDIRCKTCNVTFPIEKISNGIGSCYPIKVSGRIEGNNYTIALSNLYYAYYGKNSKI